MVPYKFADFFGSISGENAVGIFMAIALNLCIALGNMAIYTMLIFATHEHRIFFHFFVSSITYNSVLYFPVYVQALHFYC